MNAAPGLRVVVCDDDPTVRGVVGDLVEELGGEVLAETDSAIETTTLLARFRPDVVVLDLTLRHGSGVDVLGSVARLPDPPHVVVFTAYDDLAPVPGNGVDVVHKPDFEGLARCLASVGERREEGRTERRRPARVVPGATRAGVDDAPTFYRHLNDALPGDALVSLPVDAAEAERVVEVARRTVRAQDRVLLRSGDVLLLLIGAGDGGVEALRGRLAASLPFVAERLRAVDVSDDPSGAFSQLTS